MKVRHIKRRTVAAMLACPRISFKLEGPVYALLRAMPQQQRETFVREALRDYVTRGGQ